MENDEIGGNKWGRFAELSGYDVRRVGGYWDIIDPLTGWTERIIDFVWPKMSRRYNFLSELENLAVQGRFLDWARAEEIPPRYGYIARAGLMG